MKKIEAIIRKSKFDEVVKALHDAEVYFFSYWDVTGVGNEKIGKVYRGITYSTKDIQRILGEGWGSNDYFVSCGNFSLLNCAVFVCKWSPLPPINSAPPCGFDIHILHTNA